MEELPGFVETGTIFSRASDGPEPTDVYVCVTPACDLVPRMPRRKDTWEYTLHPARAVITLRAKMADVSKEHLSKAEDSRMVFLKVGEKLKTVTLVGEKPPIPMLEWLFLEDMGRINEKKLFAMEVGRPVPAEVPAEGAHPPLNFVASEMTALGQIRAIYSSRILQYAGQHLARIGVDFVSYPAEPIAEKPAGKPAAKATKPNG